MSAHFWHSYILTLHHYYFITNATQYITFVIKCPCVNNHRGCIAGVWFHRLLPSWASHWLSALFWARFWQNLWTTLYRFRENATPLRCTGCHSLTRRLFAIQRCTTYRSGRVRDRSVLTSKISLRKAFAFRLARRRHREERWVYQRDGKEHGMV